MTRALLLAVSVAAMVSAAAAQGAQVPKLAGCIPGTTPTVRPKQVIVACGDANFYFTNLVWTAWNGTRASAGGIAHLNDCTPYCAAGHFHTYRVTVTLTRPRSCKNGAEEFTRMTWRFPAAHPAGQPRTAGQPLPCR